MNKIVWGFFWNKMPTLEQVGMWNSITIYISMKHSGEKSHNKWKKMVVFFLHQNVYFEIGLWFVMTFLCPWMCGLVKGSSKIDGAGNSWSIFSNSC